MDDCGVIERLQNPMLVSFVVHVRLVLESLILIFVTLNPSVPMLLTVTLIPLNPGVWENGAASFVVSTTFSIFGISLILLSLSEADDTKMDSKVLELVFAHATTPAPMTATAVNIIVVVTTVLRARRLFLTSTMIENRP